MKKNKLPNLVSILILTLLTSIVWISLSVYRAFTNKQPESVPQEVSKPLTPSLDSDTIKLIESGVFISSSEIPDDVTTGTVSQTSNGTEPLPEPTPTEIPNASSSATP